MVCNWKYVLGASSEIDAVPGESSHSYGWVLIQAPESELSMQELKVTFCIPGLVSLSCARTAGIEIQERIHPLKCPGLAWTQPSLCAGSSSKERKCGDEQADFSQVLSLLHTVVPQPNC